jgi:selenide,water dikinase
LTPSPVTTDIVLLGAGHAHVEVLRRHAMRPAPGVRLTLITREPRTPYSGMLPGVIRGDYSEDAAHIDCAPLAAAAGARLIVAAADEIDLSARRVRVTGRPGIAFDLLSVDVGGQPRMPEGGGIPVKPIGRFLARLAELETTLPPDARIAVIGGGPGGVELALALARRRLARIALVTRDKDILPTVPPRARAIARAALLAAGVEIAAGAAAIGHADGSVHLTNRQKIPADAALWATGVVAPAFIAAAGLACDGDGCIRVAATLRAISHDFVFAAGDCASIEGDPRPKAGVWAVRAGTPLSRNLARAARGLAPRPWRPQKNALVILGLGDGRAVAWRNQRFLLSGKLAWLWKDRIDRRWMRMYGDLRPMEMADARCGGCGAKIGSDALAAALAGLAPPPRADIPLGLAEADDAAITVPPPGFSVIQSVDHFRAFIDDPFVFGQIAAAHALSDIFAMGGTPWTALAIAGLPAGPKAGDDLAAMMRGAGDVLAAEGCALVGGHSAEAAETSLGFSVTGLARPDAVWRKSGLRVGDALILTKPLGTGILLAAHMRGLVRAEWLLAALDSMRRTNAAAADILRAHGALACTDVTGFGLAGHLREMLVASDLGAMLFAEALPVLDGARELARAGVASTMAPANATAAGVENPLLVDPQTSGGLLAGIPPHRATDCLDALEKTGHRAGRIGVVRARGGALILLA